MGPFGFGEIIFLFFIALIIFGPKKLPELGKTLGKGMREFKKASDDLKANWDQHVRDADNPVNDLKQTFNEIKSDAEKTTGLDEIKAELDDVKNDVKLEEPEPATPVSPASPATPEQTSKPDAN